jgi:hypothetical protein
MTFGEDWGWGAPIDTSRRILELYSEAGGRPVVATRTPSSTNVSM